MKSRVQKNNKKSESVYVYVRALARACVCVCICSSGWCCCQLSFRKWRTPPAVLWAVTFISQCLANSSKSSLKIGFQRRIWFKYLELLVIEMGRLKLDWNLLNKHLFTSSMRRENRVKCLGRDCDSEGFDTQKWVQLKRTSDPHRSDVTGLPSGAAHSGADDGFESKLSEKENTFTFQTTPRTNPVPHPFKTGLENVVF